MILDIRYHKKAPEQIQKVRLTTVYPNYDAGVSPELVIHFYQDTRTRFIPLSEIDSITVTND